MKHTVTQSASYGSDSCLVTRVTAFPTCYSDKIVNAGLVLTISASYSMGSFPLTMDSTAPVNHVCNSYSDKIYKN